ncbi:hypothetical protein [Streptacidiphilus jiangxiensis]|uniref:Uncharacterized protein n=1 Tax=Streptacidiphilus jiangxiensis TaxID=235985 RepID=A0A1H7X3A2_STRJI|nr:hypothetical protein [Streptacidiphilus jiangxiensis]SEM27677.1 hypothetical protein SAMN05414137_12276 [Streptacidiphilus jiangxiensis]
MTTRALTDRAANRDAGGAAAARAAAVSPTLAHRVLSLLAVVVLFQGLPTLLRAEATSRVYLSVGFGLLYGALLALAVLTVVARGERGLRRLDVAVLLAALARLGLQAAYATGSGAPPYHDDEGALVTMAARSLAAGGHVYGAHFPGAARLFQVGMTPLMDGRTADTFGYPPLSVLLTAPFGAHGMLPLPGWVPVAGLWSLGALAVTALLMFRLLPPALRPGATVLVLGVTWMFTYAREGYPVFLALPFLVVVLAGWSRIGTGARLGRAGVVSACCLGAADAAHQLAWFLSAFLLLGVLLVRRGELGRWRPALAVTARYGALAAGVFLLLNLPFLLLDGGAWLPGVLTVLTQHASPQGLGPVDVSLWLTSGSGALGLYSAAAAAALLATLVALALWPSRLAPALALLPWPAFFLSTRSTETYFVLLAPLWLVALACNERALFGAAWAWRAGPLRRRTVRLALPPLLALPALTLLLVAIATPPPFRVTATASGPRSGHTVGLSRITATLRNTGDLPLAPAFATGVNAWLDFDWRVVSGPHTVPAHGTAVYVLRRIGAPLAPNPAGPTWLQVLTDGPMTLTNQRLTITR